MGSARIQRVTRTRCGSERARRPGRARGDRCSGRGEVPQRVTAHPARLRVRLPGGGPAARRAGEPVRHRPVRVRGGPAGRRHRDGAGGRRLAADHADPARPARPRGRARHPQGIAARPGRRASRRCRPPRLQAGERPGRAGRFVQARRLRDRGGLRHHGRCGGDPLVHVPGAVDRRARFTGHRCVRGHGHLLRVPDGAQALLGRQLRGTGVAARRGAGPGRRGARSGARAHPPRSGQGPGATACAGGGVRH